MYIFATLEGTGLSPVQKEDIGDLIDECVITFEDIFFEDHPNAIYRLIYKEHILVACMITDKDSIHYLAVKESYRRQGLGKILVSQIIGSKWNVEAMTGSRQFWEKMYTLYPNILNIDYLDNT